MALSSFQRLLFVVLVAVAAAVGGARAFAAEPIGRTPVPHPPLPANEKKCVADTEFMRKNHMKMLYHQRKDTVHEGVRTKQYSLADCFTCHVVKDAKGQPVTYADPKHFCRSCHSYAAVKIDCFECHASVPGQMGKLVDNDPDAAGRFASNADDKAVAALKAHMAEMKQ